MATYARPFNLHLADGTLRNGVAFPSGRHITEGVNCLLECVAADMPTLLANYRGATVTWADEATE